MPNRVPKPLKDSPPIFSGSVQQARIVRLPLIPRDQATHADRLLNETAHVHDLTFHRWLQSVIDEQVAPPPNGVHTTAAPAASLSRLSLVLKRLRRRS